MNMYVLITDEMMMMVLLKLPALYLKIGSSLVPVAHLAEKDNFLITKLWECFRVLQHTVSAGEERRNNVETKTLHANISFIIKHSHSRSEFLTEAVVC